MDVVEFQATGKQDEAASVLRTLGSGLPDDCNVAMHLGPEGIRYIVSAERLTQHILEIQNGAGRARWQLIAWRTEPPSDGVALSA